MSPNHNTPTAEAGTAPSRQFRSCCGRSGILDPRSFPHVHVHPKPQVYNSDLLHLKLAYLHPRPCSKANCVAEAAREGERVPSRGPLCIQTKPSQTQDSCADCLCTPDGNHPSTPAKGLIRCSRAGRFPKMVLKRNWWWVWIVGARVRIDPSLTRQALGLSALGRRV